MYMRRAADVALGVLSQAARKLDTADPTRAAGLPAALSESLGAPLQGGWGGRRSRLFEPSFSETSSNSIGFVVTPEDGAMTSSDRQAISTNSVRGLVSANFGDDALRWLDARSEGFRGQRCGARGFGAMYSAGLDATGLSEAGVTYAWGPETAGQLAPPVHDMALAAVQSLSALEPFATTIRTGRYSGGQQVSFEINRDLPLDNLRPLMDAFNMGHQHGSLLTLTSFVLGARFTLPAHSATLTVMRARSGHELRLDINLDALPDAPEQLLPLLRLPLVERPRNLAALDRWVTAMTPDGYFGPGAVSVLSIRVRPDMAARLAIFLRPVLMQPSEPQQAAPAYEPAVAAQGW
jgi:hypothetical protein